MYPRLSIKKKSYALVLHRSSTPVVLRSRGAVYGRLETSHLKLDFSNPIMQQLRRTSSSISSSCSPAPEPITHFAILFEFNEGNENEAASFSREKRLRVATRISRVRIFPSSRKACANSRKLCIHPYPIRHTDTAHIYVNLWIKKRMQIKG